MAGRRGADHTILHFVGMVSCTSLTFLMRGFRRKVVESMWILQLRSSWVQLEAFLKLWFGVSERGFQVKDDIRWMDGGYS